MVSVQNPPITDPTGQLILGALESIKNSIHPTVVGSGLTVDALTKILDTKNKIYLGELDPDPSLGNDGDFYIKYEWVPQVDNTHLAMVDSLYAKLPPEDPEHIDPSVNRWQVCFTEKDDKFGIFTKTNNKNITISSVYKNIYEDKIVLETSFGVRPKTELAFDVGIQMLITCDEYEKKIDPESTSSEMAYFIYGDTKIKIDFYLNNIDLNYGKEIVVEDGENYALFHIVNSDIEGYRSHDFKVVLSVMNGHVQINRGDLRLSIAGNGIVTSGFTGTIDVEEEVGSVLLFEDTFIESLSDSGEASNVNVDSTEDITDSIQSVDFSNIFNVETINDSLLDIDIVQE